MFGNAFSEAGSTVLQSVAKDLQQYFYRFYEIRDLLSIYTWEAVNSIFFRKEVIQAVWTYRSAYCIKLKYHGQSQSVQDSGESQKSVWVGFRH